MERIHTLIDKLAQQKTQGAPPAHLLFTVQLLHQELTQLQSRNGSFNNRKVAVTLPVSLNLSEESLRMPYTEVGKDKEVFVLDTPDVILEEPVEAPIEVPQAKPYVLAKPAVAEVRYEPAPTPREEEASPSYNRPSYYNSAFEAVAEAPTLPVRERVELHHVIGEQKESLNDRLKEQRTEVAHLLKETPVKDLRKAIGINDRFVFVRELFRGDEAMYERSIKTINNFNIHSEAEYWITRELKLKLAWNEDHETVRHFNQLVRRRFS